MLLALPLLPLLALANAYSNPGACSGDCWTHDPGLFQRASDGKYFRFATGGGVHVASADSIKGPWTDDGYALPNGSSIDHPGNTNLWVCPVQPSKAPNPRLMDAYRPPTSTTKTPNTTCTTPSRRSGPKTPSSASPARPLWKSAPGPTTAPSGCPRPPKSPTTPSTPTG